MFKWLINAKEKDYVQYLFLKEFINYLQDMKFIDEIDNTDKFIDDIASDIKMENCTCKIGNEIKYMDICLSSEKANFICTIENKLDAKINTDNKTNKTQLEFYVNHIEKSPYHKKLKIYLCVNSNLREETDNLLKKHGYKTMEYSDVIIMLYKILKKKGKEPDELKFEKEEKIELLEKMINYLAKKGDEKNKKLIAKIITKIKNNEQIKVKSDNFPKKFDYCDFEELFKNKSEDYILKFIAEYIQYWEYFADFNDGYSKIVDVKIDNKIYHINFCSVVDLWWKHYGKKNI